MKKCLILSLICLMALTTDAFAIGRRFISNGGCANGTCGVPIVQGGCANGACNIVQQEIVPTFAYPILVPAFQFQYVPPTYAATTLPVIPVTGYPVATPAVQPVAPYGYAQAPYPTQPQPQYPNNMAYNPSNFNNEKIRELAKALLDEMARQAESDNGPPAVPGTVRPATTPPPQPQQPNVLNPQLNPQVISQVAISSMSRTCAYCHTGVGSKKDMIIFNQPGLLNQNANWSAIKKEIESGRMPPKDSQFKLTPQERLAIIQWLSTNGVN